MSHTLHGHCPHAFIHSGTSARACWARHDDDAIGFIQNDRAREQALKELADLVYTAFQYAAAAGWELDEALDRVHKSNLSKLVDGKPLKREDGKVLKGPNYEPPYLTDLI